MINSIGTMERGMGRKYCESKIPIFHSKKLTTGRLKKKLNVIVGI